MAKSSGMAVLTAVVAMLVTVATAASPSPASCDSAASALLPCYSYVTGPDAKPPTDCCSGLSGLNTNSPTCLCQLISQLNGTAASQPSVNVTKAFDLPKDCAIALKTSDCPALANLPTPPTSPSTAVPTTSPPATSIASPEASPTAVNDVPRLLPTSWMVAGAAAALAVVQAL